MSQNTEPGAGDAGTVGDQVWRHPDHTGKSQPAQPNADIARAAVKAAADRAEMRAANLVAGKNSRGANTVRPSDDDLHRAARKSLHDGHHAVFRILPATVGKLIENKVWKTRGPKFKNFGEYALDQSSDGLGIENNQLLWLLRCAIDIDGAHAKEWLSVLEEVERSVKVWAKAEGKQIRSFNGNSLETLGKACSQGYTDGKITYLPSRAHRSLDGRLIRLKKSAPDSYRKFISGELSVGEAVREAGMHRKGNARDPVARAIRHIQKMETTDIKRLVQWLADQGHWEAQP